MIFYNLLVLFLVFVLAYAYFYRKYFRSTKQRKKAVFLVFVLTYAYFCSMAGLYIHIPFCASRCIYCSFYSTTLLHLQNRYVNALCREMELRKVAAGSASQAISTIYLGGGTPSQLSPKNLRKLFQHIYKVYGIGNAQYSTFNIPNTEITIECNPDDLTDSFVATLSQLPVNRVSMGIQTFSDKRLRFLHRRHTAHQAIEAVTRLRHAGINNISIDLMFGFPDETLDDWQRDIDAALALNVEHISAYSLTYEEGTSLYHMLQGAGEKGNEETRIEKLNEEIERQMYELLIDSLEAAGYEHYEISNFAKIIQKSPHHPSSCRSLHNSNYWNGTSYIGIGAAAHSYNTVSRQWNVADIRKYMESIEQGIIPCEREELDDATRYNDLITTALRTREGIFLPSLEQPYRNYFMENAKNAIGNGLLDIDNDHIHLTRKGLFVSDDVMSDLIYI